MGYQDITLLIVAGVLGLIYVASRWLEEDCKRIEKLQKVEEN